MVFTAAVLIPHPMPERMRLVGGSDDGSDHSVRIDGPEPYTIRTIERIGRRMDENGGVHGIADDVRSMATLAAKELLLSTTGAATTRDEEMMRLQRMGDEATELGDKVFDGSVWTVHPIVVDGIRFALWLTTPANGFAAVADLGPCLVTLHGSAVPEGREFSMKEISTLTFAEI